MSPAPAGSVAEIKGVWGQRNRNREARRSKLTADETELIKFCPVAGGDFFCFLLDATGSALTQPYQRGWIDTYRGRYSVQYLWISWSSESLAGFYVLSTCAQMYLQHCNFAKFCAPATEAAGARREHA